MEKDVSSVRAVTTRWLRLMLLDVWLREMPALFAVRALAAFSQAAPAFEQPANTSKSSSRFAPLV